MLPDYNTRFEIKFDADHVSQAFRVQKATPPTAITGLLNIPQPAPAIFLTGGAGSMSPEDIERTREIIDMLAHFAVEHKAVIIDGGTNSGIMQMMGAARGKYNLTFPLIGIAPLKKVTFPGYTNPEYEAELDKNHTHFILIDAESWGDESEMILGLTGVISGSGKLPALGILINGGMIARQEVYLAATKEFRMPIVILEGSGRAADEIAAAFKTGRANQRILQAILAGGDIQLVNTVEGADAMRNKLLTRFTR